MALPKIYNYLEHQWHNNTTPSINEDELNAISYGLSEVDDRVIAITGTLMEDVPRILEDMEVLEPAIATIDANVERSETAADDAEAEALKSEGYALGTQDGVEVTSGEYYQNNAKYYANIANPPIENTVDFTDIIIISDAINKAAKDVHLKVEPIQDLHGYNYPWVGGAGKNKLDFTVSSLKMLNTNGTWSGNVYTYGNVTFTVLVDNANNVTGIKVNGTSNGTVTFFLVKNEDVSCPYNGYVLNGCPSGGSTSTYYLRISDNVIVSNSDVGDGVTIAINDTGRWNCFIEMKDNVTISNLVYYPMIRTANESASYESPTNICPISGWNNAKVVRAGKNIFDKSDVIANRYISDVDGSSKSGGTDYASGWIPVKGGQKIISSTGSTKWAACYDSSKNFIQGYSSTGLIDGITLPDNAFFIRSTIVNEHLDDCQIEYGETATTYEPYQGEELTISLNGTRYGGTLDVTSGVLTLDKGYAYFDGSEDESWVIEGQGSSPDRTRVKISVSPLPNAKTPSDNNDVVNAICNQYIATSANNTYLHAEQGFALTTDGRVMYFYDATITDTTTISEWRSRLATNPLQFVYELATPQTIQLTPTQVYLLYGYNTLFGDCGDISLTYDASGIIHIDEAKLDTETLKTIAAASSDFADFKARIAAL